MERGKKSREGKEGDEKRAVLWECKGNFWGDEWDASITLPGRVQRIKCRVVLECPRGHDPTPSSSSSSSRSSTSLRRGANPARDGLEPQLPHGMEVGRGRKDREDHSISSFTMVIPKDQDGTSLSPFPPPSQ